MSNNYDHPVTEEERRKTIAETQKLEVETEQAKAGLDKTRAELQKFKDEEYRAKEKHLLELEALRVAVDKGKVSLEVENIARNRHRREENMILACDWNHNTYSFSEPIDADTVQGCMAQVNSWVRQHEALASISEIPPLHIEVVFDSPGGSVFDGMHLFDYLRYIRAKGYEITTVALGMTASMAGILLQAGTTRVIGEESYLLIHRVSESRFMDTANSDIMQDRIKRLQKLEGRVLKIFSDRAAKTLVARDSSLTYEDTYEATRKLIESKWTKNEWWIDSDEAFKYGFVDEIR